MSPHAQSLCLDPKQHLADVEASVKIWIVDETLPAHRGSWFFEVDSHDDVKIFHELICSFLELVC